MPQKTPVFRYISRACTSLGINSTVRRQIHTMFTGKGLLLSCIVTMMMHLSYLASQPIETRTFLQQAKSLDLPLRNLQHAGDSYRKHILQVNDSLELLEGVVLVGKNTTDKEIQTSTCVIINCLKHTLPEIVRNFTQPDQHGARDQDRHKIISNITVFIKQLEPLASCGQNQTECVNTTGLQDYKIKETGLQIINTTQQWMKSLM